MESIPASTLIPEHPSLKAALGEAGTAAVEPGAVPASLSFAGLLRLLITGESPQASSEVRGPTLPQDGQTLTDEGGNSWPLLLPLAGSQVVIPTVPVTAAHPLHQDSEGESAAAATLLAVRDSLVPAKSLLDGAQLLRAAADGSGDEREAEMLLLATAADEAQLQPLGDAKRATEGAGQNVLYTPTAASGSAGTELPMEPQRFVISPRLDAPQWEDAFTSRLVWMAKEQHQFVELRLNPPELGLVNVRMALHQNDATIAIGVHNAMVREAIEASLPRLRELLAESGVSLMNVDVSSSQGFSSEGRGSAARHEGYRSLLGASEGADIDPLSQSGLGKFQSISRGIVDRYA